MRELEKILEEFGSYICDDLCYYRETSADKKDDEMEEICAGCKVGEYLESICKHMNDGWIPVEKFGLPTSNEHDFRFWITIQYANGFRRTIKAKYDFFDKCFAHQNGKKILQDVIAYKYYSAPEPYRPERRI